MRIQTTRFNAVDIESDDILFFRNGLLGFEECQHWVILADADNPAVAWLQSMQKPEVALPVVSPRRFVADYQVRIDPSDVDTLQLKSMEQAFVLGIVSRDRDVLTLNLRAPVIINLDRRLGCQVITVDQQPFQYELAALPLPLRRTA
ncbi:MAG TPA: flagellar assembly protein FliW [Pirellulaceae bacterium]|nr:flagellar assembly protein FliW [Pirellulaceae bacterium]HMO92743.1 flagellar assembly protein FliW [Pirellulaceae bacterium]HMP70295.1 flagellar assembly protein FliW [Pirellulaceae bacterium]